MNRERVAGLNDDTTAMRFTFVTRHDGVSSALEPAPAILVRGGSVSITDGPFAETKETDIREACSEAASPSR